MQTSIDIVIPSFRLNEAFLLPMLRLPKPAGLDIKYYLIADNPAIKPGQALSDLIDNKTVFLLVNEQNMGAGLTRNRGIDAGTGEWILFIDDDVQVRDDLLFAYAKALEQFPNETGFAGMVALEEPINDFTRAISLNKTLDIFRVAADFPHTAWAATANVMVKRSAIGDIRFSAAIPRTGGGEEVDFFLKVKEKNNDRNLKCLPAAWVTHPWWGGGKMNLKRNFYYGIGNSILIMRNQRYAWNGFFNTVEILFFSTITGLALLFTRPRLLPAVFLFMLFTVLLEYLYQIVNIYQQTRKVELKTAFLNMLINIADDGGVLAGNLQRFRLKGIGERFNYDGNPVTRNYQFNRKKIFKFVLYLIAIIILIRCFN
ncbi:glycosyltransferase family A protein [Chitinophaga sp. MM2321]|uniref:glycosyltransferase family 2 protein n=1 Tax=Chitinophaga sp. MM2321 TaxID=3137178 RepID=UPI0032D5853E